MAGYTRNDTSNNIATGNVINAADLDGEFDALVAAFHASTGHTHDGTAANGAPITKVGPAQDLVVSTGAITPKTDNTVDLGSSSFEFKDLYIDGTANIDALVADTADINAGTIDGVTLGTNSAVTEAQIDNININGNTISSTDTNGNINLVPNGTGDVILTADTIQVGDSNTDVTVTTNGTGDLIFNTNAGTNSGVIRIYDGANGNIALTPNGTGEVDISKVDIDSGAIDGTAIGANSASTGSFTTLTTSSTVTHNGGTANGVAYLNGSKVLTTGSALTFDGTNLGIGTSSPLARLDVQGGSIKVKGYSNPNNSDGYALSSGVTGNISYLQSYYGNGSSVVGVPLTFDASYFAWRNIDSGYAEEMRLTSTGLGIGTSSPALPLHVYNSGAALAYFESTNANGPYVIWRSSGTSIGDVGSGKGISGSGNATDFMIASRSTYPLLFGTSSTERARIDSSGNLLVGTTSAFSSNYKIQVLGVTSGNGFYYKNTTDGGNAALFVNAAGSGVGSINVGASSTAYNTSSDHRLKENIQPMTGALATVAQLNPVTYNWKANGSAGQGFIAHELQEVVPDAVTGEKDAVNAEGKPVYQGIDTSFLVATLTAAIQEQQALIATLTARVAALESN